MDYDAEIKQAKKIIATTKSEYLKRDTEKHLRRLLKAKRTQEFTNRRSIHEVL